MKKDFYVFITVMAMYCLALVWCCDVRSELGLDPLSVRAVCTGIILAFWGWCMSDAWITWQATRSLARGDKVRARRAMRVRARLALLANPKRH